VSAGLFVVSYQNIGPNGILYDCGYNNYSSNLIAFCFEFQQLDFLSH